MGCRYEVWRGCGGLCLRGRGFEKGERWKVATKGYERVVGKQ